MKRVILILVIILLGKFSFSQQDKLNKVFYFGSDYLAMTSIIPTDSGYVLAGMFYGKIAVCLVDSSATLKWLNLFSDTTLMHSLEYSPNNFKKTSDGNYIAVGTIQNGIATFNRLFLLKLDSNFNKVYMKAMLNDTACDGCLHGRYIFENNNHDYILLGENSRDSSGALNTGSFQDGFLFKTDTNGTILNHKLYAGIYNNTDWLNCGLQMGNYYYLLGGTQSYAPSYITGWDRNDGWVVKTDLQGNEIASQNYGNPNIYDADFPFAFIILGNKILTGKDYGIAMHASGFRMFKPYLYVINDDLSIYKELSFKESYSSGDTLFNSSFIQGIVNADSSLTFLGRDIALNTVTYNSIYNKGSILTMDKNFNVRYFRNYIHDGGEFTNINPTVITSTKDGGFIFGGYVVDHTLSPIQQSWLVKTDSLGCDGFHSCDDTTLVCQILQAPDTACKNDTAWLQVKFKGCSAPYFIYANSILALDSVYYPYTLPLWIDTLMPYYPTTTGMQQVIVKVNDPWGWYNTDTVQIFVKSCGTGSIEEAWYPKKVEIYPNPATNELHVKIRQNTTTPVTITIYDIQGKSVKQIITNKYETFIDISELPQGVYCISLIENNINYNEKFVKL